MAIEPLGSVMTVQAQAAVKVTDSKPAVDNKEVLTANQVANVDVQTMAVSKIDTEDKKNAGTDAKEQQQGTNDKIKKAVEKLNKSMPHSEAVFGIHEDTNRVMIKIINRDTKELIREIPPEETLDMIAKVWELAGILVDVKR